MMKFNMVIAALCIAAAAYGRNDTCGVFFINTENRKVPITAEIADTDEKRRLGLMFRKTLPMDRGMVFVFEQEQRLNFWMKNTFIPLDIAFVDKNFSIVKTHTMKPLDSTVYYPSVYPVMYAIEVNGDWLSRHRITSGCKVIFNGCIGK